MTTLTLAQPAVEQSRIERTAEGRLILNYYWLDFAVPDSDGELLDEDGIYTNTYDLYFPFADNSPSKEDTENILKAIYGEQTKLLGMMLREKIDIDGNVIWQHPCVGDEDEF
jgi:hypothetical protein